MRKYPPLTGGYFHLDKIKESLMAANLIFKITSRIMEKRK